MRPTLLVHGLGRTPVSMFPLAGTVRRAGGRTLFFAYCAAVESLDGIIARLKRTLVDRRPEFLIAHSLGGLLLRLALAELPPMPVRQFVMLGTPNQPPRLARSLSRYRPFHWAFGECGRFLATAAGYARFPPVPCPVTVFAGTAGPTGRFSPFGGEPNDGVVSVGETKLDAAHQPELVPAWHTWMMAHPRVHARLAAVLTSSSPSDRTGPPAAGAGRV